MLLLLLHTAAAAAWFLGGIACTHEWEGEPAGAAWVSRHRACMAHTCTSSSFSTASLLTAVVVSVLSAVSPAPNATCYCPYITTKDVSIGTGQGACRSVSTELLAAAVPLYAPTSPAHARLPFPASQTFTLPTSDFPCGVKNTIQVTPKTLLYNGA